VTRVNSARGSQALVNSRQGAATGDEDENSSPAVKRGTQAVPRGARLPVLRNAPAYRILARRPADEAHDLVWPLRCQPERTGETKAEALARWNQRA